MKTVTIYLSRPHAWRWDVMNESGVIIANAGHAYATEGDCRTAVTDLLGLPRPDIHITILQPEIPHEG